MVVWLVIGFELRFRFGLMYYLILACVFVLQFVVCCFDGLVTMLLTVWFSCVRYAFVA